MLIFVLFLESCEKCRHTIVLHKILQIQCNFSFNFTNSAFNSLTQVLSRAGDALVRFCYQGGYPVYFLFITKYVSLPQCCACSVSDLWEPPPWGLQCLDNHCWHNKTYMHKDLRKYTELNLIVSYKMYIVSLSF